MGRLIGVCFLVTTKCNLRCEFCYAPLNSYKNNELSGYLRIIDKIKSLGFLKITFSGGEPFLVDGLLDILRHARKQNIKVALTSNGMMIAREDVDELGKCLDEMTLPVDTLKQDRLVYLRTSMFSIHKTFELIESFLLTPVKLDVSTVVTRFNSDECEDIFYKINHFGIKKWKISQYSRFDVKKYAAFDLSIDDISFNLFTDFAKNLAHKSSLIVHHRNNKSINSFINILPLGDVLVGTGNGYINLGNIFHYSTQDHLVDELEKCGFDFHAHRSRHVLDLC